MELLIKDKIEVNITFLVENQNNHLIFLTKILDVTNIDKIQPFQANSIKMDLEIRERKTFPLYIGFFK